MPNRDILIFLGAGASKAADNRFPLVNEFFQKAGELIKGLPPGAPSTRREPNDPFWRFLFKADSKGLWESENRWPQYTPSIVSIKNRCRGDRREFDDESKDWLSWTLSLNSGHAWTNIEHVVGKIEKLGVKAGGNNTRKALHKFLIWLFSRLEQEAQLNYRETPHAKLIHSLSETGLLSRTVFVSFNYDLVLERSMRALDEPQRHFWQGITGYGCEWPGYYSMREGRFIKGRVMPSSDEKTLILKPHGSLAWLRSGDDIFPIADDRDANGPCAGVPMDNKDLENIIAQGAWDPVIIAPGKIKRMAGKHSWDTWKVLQRLLTNEIRKVVIIGWNVPETDEDIKNRITRFIDDRKIDNIIEKLVVCDIKGEDAFVDKMSMLFMPARTTRLLGGFENDAEKIAGELIG